MRRIVFVALLGLTCVVSGVVLYFLISSNSSNSNVFEAFNQGRVQHRESLHLTHSLSEGSIWSDPRLKTGHLANPSRPQNLEDFGKPLPESASAEVSQNLKILLALYDKGADAEFLNQLQTLIKTHPEVPEYLALEGDFFYNRGRWPEAQSAVEALIKLDPKNSFARTTLGEIQAIQGHYDTSLQTINGVLANNPSSFDALYGYLSVSDMKGDSGSGYRRIEDLYRANPTNSNIAIVMSDVLLAQNKVSESRSVIQKALLQDPENPNLLRVASADAVREGNFEQAIKLARSSLLHEDNLENKIESMKLILDSEMARGNIDAAKSIRQQILELQPTEVLSERSTPH